ncbi:MAG: RES family NAD+ phosphorylase [Gammaproteobacteria bacterium]|nr:RES family NAD+ phosphorylase [Gammaproteobacteria bacterium]
MDGLFENIMLADFHDDIHRNIVSLRESQHMYDDLSDSPVGWQAAIDLELATKPHTYMSNQAIIDRPFEEAVYDEAINHPFGKWSKTRFSDGSYGVWYGADSLETSIYETVYHWRTKLLEDAEWHTIDGIIIERKIYLVRCDAGLLNFIPKLETFPVLVDPSVACYHLTHRIGSRIHHDGHPGLISRSARCEGNIYAIFKPQVLSNPRHCCYLTYRIEGNSVAVERQPGKLFLKIHPSGHDSLFQLS